MYRVQKKSLDLSSEKTKVTKSINWRCSLFYKFIIAGHSLLVSVCVFVQEEYYGRELILADRDMVEQEADEILKGADASDVAFLVVGDPFG